MSIHKIPETAKIEETSMKEREKREMGRIRTDLALETKEKFEEDQVEIRGVVIEENYNEEKDIKTTVVKIETENGAKTMGRPQGIYITGMRRICLFRMRTITGKFPGNLPDI